MHTLFGTAKRFRLLFCRRSHFDNECHSECAFLAAFWPYSNGLSLNVLRGSPRLSPAKRLPSWTCFGRIRQKAPYFRWKVGGGGLSIDLFYLRPCAHLVAFDGFPVFLQSLLVCECHFSLHVLSHFVDGLRSFGRFGAKCACE